MKMPSRPPQNSRQGEPSWFWRRNMVFVVIAWSFFQIFLLANGPDTRVNDTVAWGLVLLIMVLVTGYTGLATAQDIAAIVTTRTARPYCDPPLEPTPPPPGDNQTVIVQQQGPPVRPEGPE